MSSCCTKREGFVLFDFKEELHDKANQLFTPQTKKTMADRTAHEVALSQQLVVTRDELEAETEQHGAALVCLNNELENTRAQLEDALATIAELQAEVSAACCQRSLNQEEASQYRAELYEERSMREILEKEKVGLTMQISRLREEVKQVSFEKQSLQELAAKELAIARSRVTLGVMSGNMPAGADVGNVVNTAQSKEDSEEEGQALLQLEAKLQSATEELEEVSSANEQLYLLNQRLLSERAGPLGSKANRQNNTWSGPVNWISNEHARQISVRQAIAVVMMAGVLRQREVLLRHCAWTCLRVEFLNHLAQSCDEKHPEVGGDTSTLRSIQSTDGGSPGEQSAIEKALDIWSSGLRNEMEDDEGDEDGMESDPNVEEGIADIWHHKGLELKPYWSHQPRQELNKAALSLCNEYASTEEGRELQAEVLARCRMDVPQVQPPAPRTCAACSILGVPYTTALC